MMCAIDTCVVLLPLQYVETMIYRENFFLMFQVFAGVYPSDQSAYSNLNRAIQKLTLNDSSVTVHNDNRYI